MAKLTLTDLSSFNPTSAMATINSNNSAIEAALELTLTRTGTAPNAMEADLDMNDNDILNLPEATAPTNPVRLQEFNELEEHVDDLEDDVSNALAQFQAAMSAIVILEGDLTAAVAAAQAAQAGAEAAAAAALVSQLAAQLAEAQAEAAAAQTAIDALTASDAAAAALVSENNAETAETNAEAAEVAAELAQQASEDAQAAAEAAALDAAQSAAEAENAADNFDDVYLGSKPSDPSVDNDGDPLVEGQLYWNNVSNTLRIYDGATWQSYTAATGMLDLVDDTSPQLGGTLDPNGFAITGYSTKTQADALYQPLDSDLTAWAAVNPSAYSNTAAIAAAYQPLDSDLTAIAAIAPSNDHIIQRKSGAWINRSIAQLLVDLAVPGTTFQPLNAELTAVAAFGSTGILNRTGAATYQFKAAPGGVLVGTTDTQTLTNKTLTSPAISTPTGIVKGDVGLGNVDNTSDATKNAAVATLTNKTLTSPVVNSPTGIVKGDVGLGNVDNTSDATKNAASVTLTNKTLTSPAINSATTVGNITTSQSDGTKSTGTYTPDPTTGNWKHITNGGAFTLAPPSSTCSLAVEILNNGSAGTITTSGFTKVNGDTLTTVNGSKFLAFITKSQNYSLLTIQALQ